MENGNGINGNGDSKAQREIAMETIMKCLRLAADPGATEGERDVAQRKAEQIMAKWQISSLEMRLKSESGKPKRTTANVKEAFENYLDPAAKWEGALASGIAECFNCKVVNVFRGRLHFFGMASDLELVDYFFSKLQLEIDSWAEDAYPKGIRARREYAYGMVCRVYQRLTDLYAAVERVMPNDCKALIVVDKALVDQKMKEVYDSLRKSTYRPKVSDAYRRGFSDGGNLNLESNRQRVNG